MPTKKRKMDGYVEKNFLGENQEGERKRIRGTMKKCGGRKEGFGWFSVVVVLFGREFGKQNKKFVLLKI